MGSRTTEHVFLRTEGPCFILSSMVCRSTVQVFAIDEFTGQISHTGTPGFDVFASIADASAFVSSRYHIFEQLHACGLIGAIHTPRYVHFAFVTQRVTVARLPFLQAFPLSDNSDGPPVEIHMIEKAEWVSLKKKCHLAPCPDPSMVKQDALMVRIAAKCDKLISEYAFDDDHFYCESLDLTRPFPAVQPPHLAPDESFLWNEHLARPFSLLDCRASCVFLLQGYVTTKVLAEVVRFKSLTDGSPDTYAQLVCTLIARHQSSHPGTRFNARGLNSEGAAGNEWEVDFFMYYSPLSQTGSSSASASSAASGPALPMEALHKWSSFTWRRGTVPLHWTQEVSVTSLGDADIRIDPVEPFRKSRNYFDMLGERLAVFPEVRPPITVPVSDPQGQMFPDQMGDRRHDIFCLSLLRTEESRKEKVLADSYAECVDQISKFYSRPLSSHGLPARAPVLTLLSYDWHKAIREVGFEQTVFGLYRKLDPFLDRINISYGAFSDTSSGYGTGVSVHERQRALFRINCADSLDRTNLGSFFVLLQVLPEMCRPLHALPLLVPELARRPEKLQVHLPFQKWAVSNFKQYVAKNMLEQVASIFVELGDRVSFLYTHSVAMHSAELRQYFASAAIPQATSNLKILLTRRFHNVFSDEERQVTYELVLGRRLPLPDMSVSLSGLATTLHVSARPMLPKLSQWRVTADDMNKRARSFLSENGLLSWRHASSPLMGATLLSDIPSSSGKLHGADDLALLRGAQKVVIVPGSSRDRKGREVPRYSTHMGDAWVCPAGETTVTMRILLTAPVYVSAVTVALRWPYSPSSMTVKICPSLDDEVLVCENVSLPVAHQDGEEITFVLTDSAGLFSETAAAAGNFSRPPATPQNDVETGLQELADAADATSENEGTSGADRDSGTAAPSSSAAASTDTSAKGGAGLLQPKKKDGRVASTASVIEDANMVDDMDAEEDFDDDEFLLQQLEKDHVPRVVFFPYGHPESTIDGSHYKMGGATDVAARIVTLTFSCPALPSGACMTIGDVHVFGDWAVHPILISPLDIGATAVTARSAGGMRSDASSTAAEKRPALPEKLFKANKAAKQFFGKIANSFVGGSKLNSSSRPPAHSRSVSGSSVSATSTESGPRLNHDEIISLTMSPTSDSSQLMGSEHYRQLVKDIIGQFSVDPSKITDPACFSFTDTLRLELLRMQLNLSPAERDRIVSDLRLPVAALDPHTYVQYRNPFIDQVVRRRILKKGTALSDMPFFQWINAQNGGQRTSATVASVRPSSYEMEAAKRASSPPSQCALCGTGFGFSSWFLSSKKRFCCHGCRRVVCQRCVSPTWKALLEYGWSAPVHRVCQDCSEVADSQMDLLQQICTLLRLLPRTYVWPSEIKQFTETEIVSLSNVTKRYYAESGFDPSSKPKQDVRQKLDMPFLCEHPFVRLLNTVRCETGDERCIAEGVFTSPALLPLRYKFVAPTNTTSVQFVIAFPMPLEVSSIVLMDDLDGHSDSDAPTMLVEAGNRLDELAAVLTCSLLEEASKQPPPSLGPLPPSPHDAMFCDLVVASPGTVPDPVPVKGSILPQLMFRIALPNAVSCQFMRFTLTVPEGAVFHWGRIFPCAVYKSSSMSVSLPSVNPPPQWLSPVSSDEFCNCSGVRRQRYHRSFLRVLEHGRVVEIGIDSMSKDSRSGSNTNLALFGDGRHPIPAPLDSECVTVHGVFLQVEHLHGIWKTQVRRLRVSVEKHFPIATASSNADLSKTMQRQLARLSKAEQMSSMDDDHGQGGSVNDPHRDLAAQGIRRMVDVAEFEVPLCSPNTMLWFDFPKAVTEVRAVRFEAVANYGASEVSIGKPRVFCRM